MRGAYGENRSWNVYHELSGLFIMQPINSVLFHRCLEIPMLASLSLFCCNMHLYINIYVLSTKYVLVACQVSMGVNLIVASHWHVFTWIWETHLAWYQQVVITGRMRWTGRSLSNWSIVSADYLQPIRRLIISTELFSVLTQSGWFFALCIAWCSQQW